MNKICWLLLLFPVIAHPQSGKKNQAVYLEDIPWSEAAKVLTKDALVIIPVGAASKEHGHHMPLSADFLQAEYLKKEIAASRKLVIAPTMNYSFYPSFLKYAGSTSLRHTTARDMMLEIVRQLASYGPKRFYVINVGISTNFPLADAASALAKEGILFYYTDYNRLGFIEDHVKTVKAGTHADELETSNLLFIAPRKVDMSKAADDTTGTPGRGRISLTPVPMKNGSYSASGVYGLSRRATKGKGKKSMDLMLKALLREIDSVQTAALPPVVDQSAMLAQYAGTYKAEDGRKIVIKAGPYYLDYIWNDVDHSNFFHLYKYANDVFASQVIDIVFVKNSGKVDRALLHFRGVQYWMVRE